MAAAVDPLAVRQRARRGHGDGRRAARARDATTCASSSQGGDGATVDIGFACLSGMFERNDDVLYICYDNEAYMNTGVQRSGATPPAARTSTTQTVGDEPGNVFGQGKNVPLIAMAHEIPYVATATIADLRDLEYKVERAMGMRGARYLHVFVTCPLGWGSASRDSIRVARLAKESGLFPVFEAEHGEVVGVSKIRRRVPVEEYLKLQRRFGHLFGDPPRLDVIARIQAIADRNIERFGLVDEDTASPRRCPTPSRAATGCPPNEAARAARMAARRRGLRGSSEETDPGRLEAPARSSCASPRTRSSGARTPRAPTTSRTARWTRRRGLMMDKPFAITLDVGSSLANKTGSWRTERPNYLRRLPPCNHACPAGENIQGWLYHAEEGDYETAWRVLMEDNPFPAIMGRVCYHPCESACNRGQLDEAVGINSVERFLGDEAIKQGWAVERARASSRASACSSWAPGPRGCSAAYHLTRLGHEVAIRDAGPRAGGMMRFGIPKYRLPRDVLDAEVQRILDMGVALELDSKVANVLEAMREGGFDAAFLAVGAHIGKRAYIPAGEAARIVDAVSLLRSMEGEERPLLGRRVVVYGGGDTAMDAARTAKRLGATEAVVVYRRTRERMPAHDVEVEEAARGGRADEVALDRQARRRGQARAREDGARRDGLPPADGRARGARGRLARAGARPGGRPVAARRRARHRGRGRRRAGRAEHDDRPPGHLRRAATWCPPSAP